MASSSSWATAAGPSEVGARPPWVGVPGPRGGETLGLLPRSGPAAGSGRGRLRGPVGRPRRPARPPPPRGRRSLPGGHPGSGTPPPPLPDCALPRTPPQPSGPRPPAGASPPRPAGGGPPSPPRALSTGSLSQGHSDGFMPPPEAAARRGCGRLDRGRSIQSRKHLNLPQWPGGPQAFKPLSHRNWPPHEAPGTRRRFAATCCRRTLPGSPGFSSGEEEQERRRGQGDGQVVVEPERKDLHRRHPQGHDHGRPGSHEGP